MVERTRGEWVKRHKHRGGFRRVKGNVDKEVSLSSVSGFETVPPVVHTGSGKRQFPHGKFHLGKWTSSFRCN